MLAFKKAEDKLLLAQQQLETVQIKQSKITYEFPRELVFWAEECRASDLQWALSRAEKDLRETKKNILTGQDRSDPLSSAAHLKIVQERVNESRAAVARSQLEMQRKHKIEKKNAPINDKIEREVNHYESKVQKAQARYGRKKNNLIEWMSAHYPAGNTNNVWNHYKRPSYKI